MKKFIIKYFSSFAYFYVHLRHRLFIALGLSLTVGVLDGFGIAMFLPLLESTDGQASSDDMGGMGFLVDFMEWIGLGTGINAVLFMLIFFFCLKGIFYFGSSYYSVFLKKYFVTKMRFDNIDRLSNFKYKSFVQTDTGRIQNTFSGEVSRVMQAYTYYFNTIQSFIMVVVYSAMAFFANAQFAFFVLLGGALTNFIYSKIYKLTKKLSRELTAGAHVYQGLLIQKVAFFKYLKATGLIYRFGNKLKQNIRTVEDIGIRMGKLSAILSGSREPLVVTVVAVVILVQVNFFETSMGVIILSLLFFYRALSYIMGLQNSWNQFISTSGSLENMTSFMRELSKSEEKFGPVKDFTFRNAITLENMSFNYGNTAILKDINLKLNKNETIAFVGESGSGKTTLVNVLTGLMNPDEGKIFIDDVDRSSLDMRVFSQKIGYITQEPVIFDDTVFNNITFWDEPTPENKAKFWDALEKASISEFVRELEEKENAELGSNGIMVSGGQKQRLSIARELYKDIEILIMDEATSALDSETEKAIQKNIDALKGRYTILIVAHRLSTIKNADKIVLLQKGYVKGIGNFYDLTQQSNIFKNMVSLQEI
ncbi:hypothetical protein EL17_17715 [Anditalea andensis]|uniref:ABC transporter ATP-binding protein n=1 Tax=Anditalea andensis TaxID=1048983 RepID=A0A074KWI6_9BACT|nr:hypothetical protein EL17_17715 [Anditalea andensis]